MRDVALPIALLLAVCILAGCTSDSAGSDAAGSTSAQSSAAASVSVGAEDLMVDMLDNRFVDGNQTVGVGSSIMYMNEGSHSHTVTIHWVGDPATTYKADQALQPGQDFTYRFDAKGTYHVFCKYHGQMTSGMYSVVTVA